MNFIDYICYSEDKEIICLTNKEGIQLYDTQYFQLLLKLNPFRIGLVGEVFKCKIFFNSQIIGFILIENDLKNYNEKKYSLIIYDIKNYEILGKITMKNSIEINDFLITKFFIIIMIKSKNKALIFKTSNLEFFKSLSNIDNGRIVYTDGFFINNSNKKGKPKKQIEKCLIAYTDYTNKVKFIGIQFILNNDKTKVLGLKKKNLIIYLNSPSLKYIGIVQSYIIASSSFGNKVHIYDLLTGKFKYCLILGNFPYEISEIHLDNKKKIISIITNNKYIKLYKLNRLSNLCNCFFIPDGDISMNKERGFFDKIKHKLGINRTEFLCRFKVNLDEFNQLHNNTIINFDKSSNDCIFIAQANKNIKKIKFDRKKSKDVLIIEELTLPDHSINKYIKTNNKLDNKKDNKLDDKLDDKNEINTLKKNNINDNDFLE